MSRTSTRAPRSCPTRPREFRRLRRQVRALRRAGVDYDDPAAEAAYYARAKPVIEAVISATAGGMRGLKVKIEALVWCAAGVDFGLGETLGERVIGSILDDLVREAGLEP
ncbi:hypothetical protein [Phenylobacterium sp.]|uniref:hypothetical protein n=1 Tax=Phenylobacterium sp. TaxID=1871053 RepID=UPI0035B0AAAD